MLIHSHDDRFAQLKQLLKNSGKDRRPTERALFEEVLIPKHPPVFHEWFLKEFPDPAKWYVECFSVVAVCDWGVRERCRSADHVELLE
jgi:hypothetical protein